MRTRLLSLSFCLLLALQVAAPQAAHGQTNQTATTADGTTHQSTLHPDGARSGVTDHPDGTRSRHTSDDGGNLSGNTSPLGGSTQVHQPGDGSMTTNTTFPDGRHVKTTKGSEGTTTTVKTPLGDPNNPTDWVEQTFHPDGTSTTTTMSGGPDPDTKTTTTGPGTTTTTTTRADGSTETITHAGTGHTVVRVDHPDGTRGITNVNPDGSSTTTVRKPDGTTDVMNVDPNGGTTRVSTQPDGTKTTTTHGPDGTVTRVTENPDGSTTTTTTKLDGTAKTTGTPATRPAAEETTPESAEPIIEAMVPSAPFPPKCGCGCGGSPQPKCPHKACVCFPSESEPINLALADLPVRLLGDGATTREVTMEIANPTDQPVTYRLPEYTQFTPQDSSLQALTSIEEAVCTVPPGETVQVRVPTVCSDFKSEAPPSENGGTYTLTPPPPHIAPVVEAAEQLASEGAFHNIPMAPVKALETVRQMAIWSIAAEVSSNPKDQVTPEVFKAELCEQLGKKPDELTPQQNEQMDEGLTNIFDAIDLTKKRAKEKM